MRFFCTNRAGCLWHCSSWRGHPVSGSTVGENASSFAIHFYFLDFRRTAKFSSGIIHIWEKHLEGMLKCLNQLLAHQTIQSIVKFSFSPILFWALFQIQIASFKHATCFKTTMLWPIRKSNLSNLVARLIWINSKWYLGSKFPNRRVFAG